MEGATAGANDHDFNINSKSFLLACLAMFLEALIDVFDQFQLFPDQRFSINRSWLGILAAKNLKKSAKHIRDLNSRLQN